MKIVAINHIEDCFDGSLIKEVILDGPTTEAFIRYIGESCRLHYFKQFARPFFKATKDHLFEVKGVEGNSSVRLFLKNRSDKPLSEFEKLISDYQ